MVIRTHQKYTSSTPIAVPASRAAESTSTKLFNFRLNGINAQLTVILCPKCKVSSTKHVLENEAKYRPGYVIDSRRRWDKVDTREHEAVVASPSRQQVSRLNEVDTYGKLQNH
jgi:hypothetical protein